MPATIFLVCSARLYYHECLKLLPDVPRVKPTTMEADDSFIRVVERFADDYVLISELVERSKVQGRPYVLFVNVPREEIQGARVYSFIGTDVKDFMRITYKDVRARELRRAAQNNVLQMVRPNHVFSGSLHAPFHP